MQNLITLTDPRSPAAEAYQSLRTNLEFSSLEQPLHSILVTGVDDTTDKSVALANLAVVMAQAGDRVTIIDGDLRRPQQHEIFDLRNQTGLATWLSRRGNRSPAADLHRGPAGLDERSRSSQPSCAAEQPAPGRRAGGNPGSRPTMCWWMRRRSLPSPTLRLWASKVDGTVLLVNAGRTKREHAQRAKTVLEKVHARIVGAVLLNAEQDAVMTGYST